MIKLVVAAVAVIAAAVAASLVHFRSPDTRLTQLPRVVAAAAAMKLAPPSHVVIVVEENKEFSDIDGNTSNAPYINELIARGSVFTHSYGVAHPSQPNYIALFAGVTNDNGDGCPATGFDSNAPNLAQELARAHLSFAGYSEDLPQRGSHICRSGTTPEYARKHNPWVDFSNVPDSQNVPFSAMPAYDALPSVSFIVPNQLDDMHSASIARGDQWLRRHVGPLVDWAMTHNTLVIVTWDESDDALGNHIPTIFIGPMVQHGRCDEPITHYRVLRTIEDMYGLGHAGDSAGVPPITSVWR